MIDERLSRREALMKAVREESHKREKESEDLSTFEMVSTDIKPSKIHKNTFLIRFILCGLLFMGFYYLYQTDTNIFQLQPQNIAKEVSRSLDTNLAIEYLEAWIKKE